MLFNAAQLSLPYVLSVYLVRDLYSGQQTSEQLIGQLTGILAASQSVGRSLTAYAWGVVSDRIGRKVCILIGTSAAMVSSFSYGMSSSFAEALLARMIPAAFFGSAVALKSMIGDSGGRASQATAMAVFNLGFGMGSVTGPAVGGVLAYPCRFEGFPFCEPGALFRQKPFLLPCLAICCLGVLAMLSNIFMMRETHPMLADAPGGWMGNLMRILCCRPRSQYATLEGEEQEGELLNTQTSDVEMGRVDSKKSRESRPEVVDLQDGEDAAAPTSRSQHRIGTKVEGEGVAGASSSGSVDEEGEEEEDAWLRQKQGTAQLPSALETRQSDPDYRWWRDGNVMLSLVGSGLIAFLFCFQDEMGPIFVSAPIHEGGLSMTLDQFTLPLSVGGIALAVFSLLVYPRLAKRYSPLTLCRAGLLLALPSTLILPMAHVFTGTNALMQACVYAAVCVNSISKICALNSSLIAVNLVAPKHNMGAVNGGAMTLQSGGRAFGPVLSGSMWAVVVSLHVKGQQFVGFGILALGFVAVQFVYTKLKLPEDS